MTAQMPDRVRLGKTTLSIQGVRGKSLFDPKNFNLPVTWISSACWRGYVATYAVKDDHLILRDLLTRFDPEMLNLSGSRYELICSYPDGTKVRCGIVAGQALVGNENDCHLKLEVNERTRVVNFCKDRVIIAQRGGGGDFQRLAYGESFLLGGCEIEVQLTGGDDVLFDSEPPRVEGHTGRWLRSGINSHCVKYSAMAVPMKFTGGILACDGFIAEHYVHMGFHPAWKFEHVEELLFEDGKLTNRENVSSRLAEIRSELAANSSEPNIAATSGKVLKWIRTAFSLEY